MSAKRIALTAVVLAIPVAGVLSRWMLPAETSADQAHGPAGAIHAGTEAFPVG